MQKCVIFVLLDYVISRIVVVLMGKRSMGENCELKGAAAFDPFSVCNVIDALPIWVDHLFGDPPKEAMPSNSVLPLFLVMLVTFHWTLCQCFVLPTFREFQDFFKRASKSVPASDELTNGWKSLLSSMLPKILPEKTADMVRTVVDMVKLVNTSQPTSNEEHFNEAAAVTKSITVDETIIRVPARSPSVMEQSLGLLRPFFGNIDPWRAILYRDPPLLSVDLADGDSQENDMTRSTSSLDSFKSNFFKSTNHDSQLLDELETEPVAARRPFGHEELAIGSIFHICDSTKLNAISAAEKHSRWNRKAFLVIHRIIEQQVEETKWWRQCATVLKIFVPNFTDDKSIISTLGSDHIRRMGSQQGSHQVHGGNYDDRVIKTGQQVTGSFDQIVLDGRFVQLILHLRVHVAVPSPVQVCQCSDVVGQIFQLDDFFLGDGIRGDVAFDISGSSKQRYQNWTEKSRSLPKINHSHRRQCQTDRKQHLKLNVQITTWPAGPRQQGDIIQHTPPRIIEPFHAHALQIGANDRERAELKQIQIGKPAPQVGIPLPVLGEDEGDSVEQHVRGEVAQVAGAGVAKTFRKPIQREQVEQASDRVEDGVRGDPVSADEEVRIRPVDPRAHPQLVQRLHGHAFDEKFPLVRGDGHVESRQHVPTVDSFAHCPLEQHPDLVLSLATIGKFAHQIANSIADIEIEYLFAAVIFNQPVQTIAEKETSLDRISLTRAQQSTFAGQRKRLVSVNDRQLTGTAVFPAVGEAQLTFAVRQS
ncbi:hypothetical protein T09_6768 [Trichinella sp. T9]|nr:hypothetical protein T09_6768 [Trichinella sp. T9]